MWMKKSSCVIHIGKLFKNISIAFDILNNVFFFFRKKSFLELIKGLKNKQNFHKFLKLLEDFNYNSKKNCFSQLKKNKELKEEILLTKAFLIKKLFKKCSVLSKIKLKDYFTKFRNNINIKSKELSKNNYKARLFYYIITNVINTNKQAKFSFILSNLNKYVQSKIKFQVFCMVLVNKLSKSQENYKAFFLKTLLSNSVNFFCKSSLNKSLKQFIFKREEFLKNKLHKGFNTFANNIKKIIESNNKEIISNKLFISLNNKVNNYNKSKLAKLFNLWKRNLIENKVLLKINLIRSKFLKYLGLIKKQNIKKIANKLKIKYLVTNLKNTMNKTNKKIKSTDKIIRILSKKIDPLKKYFIFYIKINYFVKRISFTLTKNINNNKAYAINKFKAFEKNYFQKVVSIQSLIRKNIAKKLKQNKQNQNNAIIKLLKTKLLLLSRKVDISFIKWKNIVILLELNKKANLIKSFVKKSNALKRKFLIRKVSKKLLYSHIKNIQSKICKWRCIALSMKFINLIIKLQKMTRVYLFYNKAKQRTMNLVHKNWTCYLDNMKGMKKNLKMLVIILKRFALELSFYKILLKANTDSKKEAIQRLVKVLNFKLRVLLHSSFRDYKGLFEVANEKLFTFLNKEINPSFKKKLLNSVLNKYINQKDIKIQTMQSNKMFSFIHRKIKLSNSKKIILIQSFFRGYNLKNKLIKKIISFNKLKNMFTGNCIDFSKNTQITKIFKKRISKNQSKSNIYNFSGLSVGVVFLKKSLFKGKNNLLLIRALLASMFNWKIFLEKIEYVGNENLLFKQILKFTNLTTKYIRKRVISIFKQINIKKSLENQNNKKLNEELFRKKTATLNNLIISNIINKKLLLAKSFNQFKKFSIGIKIFNASLIVHRFMTNNWKKSKLKKLFTKYYKMKLLSFPKKLR